MKDDLLYISSEELEVLLQKIELVEQGDTTARTMTNMNEDEDLSNFEGIGIGDRFEEETESSDCIGI